MSGLYGLPVYPLDYCDWLQSVNWYYLMGYRELGDERIEFGYEPIVYYGA